MEHSAESWERCLPIEHSQSLNEFIDACNRHVGLRKHSRLCFLNAAQNEAKCEWDSMGDSYDFRTETIPYGGPSSQAGGGDDLRQWFAIETRHRFEKKVFAQLDHQGFEVFLPLLTEHHVWSDRRKTITVPLFPGYAFVSIDQSRVSRHSVLQTVGLIRFVSFGGRVLPIPSKQIEDLQLLQQEKGEFSLHSFVHAGQRVRIRGGCLHGLEGTLVHNEKQRLVISIQSIQRSVSIEAEGYELELV